VTPTLVTPLLLRGDRGRTAVAILNFKLLWIVFRLTCCPPTLTSDDNRATVNDARRSRGDAPRVERSRPGYNVRSAVILSAHAWTLAYNWKNIDAFAERKIANRGLSCRATSRRRSFFPRRQRSSMPASERQMLFIHRKCPASSGIHSHNCQLPYKAYK